MPIYSPTGFLDITNATLRTSNTECQNLQIGSGNVYVTTDLTSELVLNLENITNLGNSTSNTMRFINTTTGLTVASNALVTGNVTAGSFIGDGSGLTSIPPSAITGTLSQWSDGTNSDVYIASNVGIGNVHTLTSNTLQVGANLYVRDADANVLTVTGNVAATYFEGDGSKLTGISSTLQAITTAQATTTDTVSFLNATTGFTVASNILVTGNVTAGSFMGDGSGLTGISSTLQAITDGGNVTSNVVQFSNATTGLVTTANIEVGGDLKIDGLTAGTVPYVDTDKFLKNSFISMTGDTTVITSNLDVTGNIFMRGDRFVVESETKLINDAIIGIANNNVSSATDIGILMQRPDANVAIIHHGGTNELSFAYTQNDLEATDITNDLSKELTINVVGHVITQNNLTVGGTLKLNTITAAATHSLQAVTGVGSVTSNTVQFSNVTTSLTADSNILVTGNVTAATFLGDGSGLTALPAAEITGVLPVIHGGTGVATVTGTGSLVLSDTPTFTGTVTAVTFSGSGSGLTALPAAEITGTLPNDLVTLGTHTTGNYVTSLIGGDGVTAGAAAEGGTPTVAVDLKANGGLVIESSTIAVDLSASSITGTLAVADGGTGTTTSTGTGSVVLSDAPTLTGTVTAGTFSGSGASLTSIPAAQITGTLAVANGGTGVTGSTGTGDVVLSIAPAFSGDVAFDTDTLKIDSTNNRVGIGTTSPDAELHVSGTGAIVIPSGTTAQQPTGVTGMIRFNTAVGKLEFYNGAVWSMIGGVSGTGGTITNVNGYTIHTFTSSGTFTVISGGEVEYLIVAGGGGGSNTLYCGGGGAGGMLTGTLSSLSSGSYTITRGGGGATGTNGTVGSDSQFNTIIANGGGGGGGVNSNGVNGGSGGGGGYAGGSTEGNGRVGGTGVAGQGNNGGQGNGVNGYGWGGGGGGAGAAGTTARRPNSTQPGNGGNGVQSSITGTATYYAGGAGGRIDSGGYSASGGFGGGGSGGSGSNADGTAGGTNTGGGGGPSKAGGSGIVIIRYLS